MEITGLSGVTVEGNFAWPLIRVDTDAGIHGYGEVRDHSLGHTHAEAHYADEPLDLALDLEEVVVGEDPRNIAGLFETLKPYGGWGRHGGGVSAIEMAAVDIAGKYHDAPAWQLLGGQHRDAVRVYVDCRAGEPVTDSRTSYSLEGNDYTPAGYADHAARREAEGFDFLKFDVDPRAAEQVTGAPGVRDDHLTETGLDYLESVVAALRDAVDSSTHLGLDCAAMEQLPVTDVIRVGRVLDDYGISAYEDVRHDHDVAGWERVTDAIETPTITGEDLYTLDGFRELVRREAVDLVGPDLLTAGGIRETVRIGEFANQHGIPANLHFAASPVGFMASVHAAAAIPDLLALEFHAVGVDWWADLVDAPDPLFEDGYAPVPDTPGLGIELNESAVAAHAIGDGQFDHDTG